MKNKGFTLLLAIMAVSVVLMIGVGVFNIILKELEFSSLGRETLKASYAAESGIECINYWALSKGIVSTTSPVLINCDGQSVTLKDDDGGPWLVGNFTLTLDNGSCVNVEVDKTSSDTVVRARGYNIGCNDSSPRKVQWGRGTRY